MYSFDFIFAFYDKMNLYLCTVEQIDRNKAGFFKVKMIGLGLEDGFWGQLKAIITGALEFSRMEPCYDGFWRNYMNENEDVKRAVKTAFPEISNNFLGPLIDNAIATGKISHRYDRGFIYLTINL